ncbi:helix-turn-helix transcriptional regulator [Phreatobacter aquaticus]|uniref:Helix-turn-helix transcriptional regulator n=1 Tax=Phreatobacter aquaticus TaxID=2570229 RepID=A0A4D7QJJ4_9HYPH|nr:AraC family transcriptional regulator [Phreatobacter aquaticus]QCK86811.1 helix-turn-helix transcriptional regulator [Phreatobacter aquaticus]
MIASADLALRAGTAMLLVVMAVLLLRDVGRSQAGRIAAAFALGSAAYALSSAAGFFAEREAWRSLLLALATANTVTFWLFARALFDDGFTLKPWHGLAWLAFFAASLWLCNAPGAPPGLGLALGLAALAVNLAALGASLGSWQTDLVERRRRLRVVVLVAGALHGAAYAATGLLVPVGGVSPEASLAHAASLALIVAVAAWSFLSTAAGDLFPVAASTDVPAAVGAPSSDPADGLLAAALSRLMTEERAYRQEGLTIGMLANRLHVPEYRLRRLINGRLGYRNFSAYLNGYRIAEAQAALADPKQAEVPITTIALDAGFQSLGPFNRAFKTETGVTPSEYRRAAIIAA